MAVALDVTALAADHEQHEVLALGRIRDAPWRGRFGVEEPARPELANLAFHLDLRTAAVHEVELVLGVVVVTEALHARREDDRVDAERGYAERSPDAAKAVALAQILDRP